MPVIVESTGEHPFLPSLGSSQAIESLRALKQDIRPLEIAIVNLMADKVATERQLALWLGHTPLQVKLTFVATDRYVQAIEGGRESKNTPSSHIRNFYKSWSEIKDRKFDGLIVTGVNARQPRVTDEAFWDEVSTILAWSEESAFSSLFLCWGGKAALKHFHGIDSLRGEKKVWGLFEHRIVDDTTGLLFGFPDRFPLPVSRWKAPDEKAIMNSSNLEVVASSDDGGANVLVEPAPLGEGRFYARRVYVLGHPEYETETLQHEYQRDLARGGADLLPKNYFEDASRQTPSNRWRYTGFLYTNWINMIYDATPYDLEAIPAHFLNI